LSLEKTEITRRFLGFLQQRAGKAKAVYILGDLFDAWIGDDDNTPPNPAIKRRYANLPLPVCGYLLQGNRDFLLGAAFCAETGIRLLDEYAVIGLERRQALLTHGDLLCTDDLPYQAFRLNPTARNGSNSCYPSHYLFACWRLAGIDFAVIFTNATNPKRNHGC